MTRAIPVMLALTAALLSGCGDLPRPFAGNPGATAERLALPPPSRLAIPAPNEALLPERDARAWADALAKALIARDLPVSANTPGRRDWRLLLSAKVVGAAVVPTYTISNPRGEAQGSLDGPPVPAQQWAEAGRVQADAAVAEAPKIAELLATIEAHRQESDPNSLLNRPPKLFLTAVNGAPGDGNTALMRQMQQRLPKLGDQVLDQAMGADFTVAGDVQTAPGAGKTTRIEIVWTVLDARGNERGKVVQINEVPIGSLDRYWGEVAEAVAGEASGGVHDVVVEASGRGSKPTG